MKRVFILLLSIAILSCNSSEKQAQPEEKVVDNPELKTIYKEDQSDRMVSDMDWAYVMKRDKAREARVYELLDSNLVRTASDYSNAAMIFQHGGDTTASAMAVKMMRKAIELDSSINKWLLAAAIDRDLMRREQPQIYGTQYRRMNDGSWTFYDIDTTRITDEEREAYGVGTLAEQREKLSNMNRKDLSELLESGKSVDEIVAFCLAEDKTQSNYNLSEMGINMFGYDLIAQDNVEEALKVFELNTMMYPEDYNTYDSYGECLLMLGRKEEAIEAYRKSLELNPKNKIAEEVLASINDK